MSTENKCLVSIAATPVNFSMPSMLYLTAVIKYELYSKYNSDTRYLTNEFEIQYTQAGGRQGYCVYPYCLSATACKTGGAIWRLFE